MTTTRPSPFLVRSLVAFGLFGASPLVGGATAPPTARLVERSDVMAYLRAVEVAYEREDLDSLLELTGEQLRRGASFQLGRLFSERNYFRLRQRLLSFEARPDGLAEIDVVMELRSRRADESWDRREKSRTRKVLGWRDGRVRVLELGTPADPQLPAKPPWAPEAWRGSVSVHPRPLVAFGTPEGRVDADLTVTLRNVSSTPQDRVQFGLHPFVTKLRAGLGADGTLEVEREEGAADVWTVHLPASIGPGASIDLRVVHALEIVGAGRHAFVSPDRAWLHSPSAWHPVFTPAGATDQPRADHDLTVEVPGELTAVAPGAADGMTRTPDGRARHRFRSRFPGAELSVFVGRLRHDEIPLSEGVVLDLHRPEGADGPPPPALGRVLSSALSEATATLGAPPIDRMTIVQGETDVLRAAPTFLALPEIDPDGAELFWRRDRQLHVYLAHHVYHAWLIDAVRPADSTAELLAEALCDDLALRWLGGHVDDALPTWHREKILAPARLRPTADRPLVSNLPDYPLGEVFGRGKAMVLLGGWRQFAGDDGWQGALRRLYEEHRGGTIGGAQFVDAMVGDDPRLQAWAAAWLFGSGLTNVVVDEPRTTELRPEGEQRRLLRNEVSVRNEGPGPVAVEVRVLVDAPGSSWRKWLVELGPEGSTVLAWEDENPVRRVEADPNQFLWESDILDTAWPRRRAKAKAPPGEARSVGAEDRRRLDELMKRR